MQTKPSPQNQDEQLFGRLTSGWRLKIYTVIFEVDTRAGRLFDLALIALILASVGVVVLDSIAELHARHSALFSALEWLFTAEYMDRLSCVRRPGRYADLPSHSGAGAACADRGAGVAPAAGFPHPEVHYQQANVWGVTATRVGNSAKRKVCVDYPVQELQQGEFVLEAIGA